MGHMLAGVRYVTTFSTAGEGQTLLSRYVGRLYGARLVALTGSGRAVLYDHTNVPQNPITVLVAHSQPVDFPAQPVHLPIDRGLYVSFTGSVGVQALSVLWDRGTGSDAGGGA